MENSITITHILGKKTMIIDLIDQEEQSLFFWIDITRTLKVEGLSHAHVLRSTSNGVEHLIYSDMQEFQNAPVKYDKVLVTYIYQTFTNSDASAISEELGLLQPVLRTKNKKTLKAINI